MPSFLAKIKKDYTIQKLGETISLLKQALTLDAKYLTHH